MRRGASSLTTIVLTWFLAPEDFGLIAMTTIFIAMSNIIVDSGFKQALIKKKNIDSHDMSTAFVVNMTIAVTVYCMLFMIAPLIASFYKQETLTQVLRILSLAVIFNAYTVVQEAMLQKTMAFRRQLTIALPSTVLSCTLAILLAATGWGVWALVVQNISAAMLNAYFYARASIWTPSLTFDKQAFKEFFKFGSFLTLQKLTNQPFLHMYVILIAKMFPASMAGLYYFAEKIKDLLITQLVTSIQTVTYPALVHIHDDKHKLLDAYRKLIRVITFAIFPVLIFFAVCAQPLFSVLQQKWWAASAFFQLLCVASLLYPMHLISVNIMKITNRTDLVFYVGLGKNIITTIIFVYSLQFGIQGILIGQIASSLVCYIPSSYYSKKLIGYGYLDQCMDFLPTLGITMVIGGTIGLLMHYFNLTGFLAGIGCCMLGFVLYITLAHMLKLNAYTLIRAMLQEKFKRRTA